MVHLWEYNQAGEQKSNPRKQNEEQRMVTTGGDGSERNGWEVVWFLTEGGQLLGGWTGKRWTGIGEAATAEKRQYTRRSLRRLSD